MQGTIRRINSPLTAYAFVGIGVVLAVATVWFFPGIRDTLIILIIVAGSIQLHRTTRELSERLDRYEISGGWRSLVGKD